MDIIPSEYQLKIFDFVEHGVGNAVVDAKAGSGKTTTAIKCLDFIDPKKKVLFTAFNKDIAGKLKDKTLDNKNVKALTFHKLGFSIIQNYFERQMDINDYKYITYINSNLEALSEGIYNNLKPLEKTSYYINIIKLVDLARYNICQCESEISSICNKYGIFLISNEALVVEKLLEWGKTDLSSVDFTDMEWLPCELDLPVGFHKYDWIIIDEAQDASPIKQMLIKKCFKRNTRFMAIGDTSQTINSWCGADHESFNNFLKMDNTKAFILPISYRCAISIINKAKIFEPNICAAENAIKGIVNEHANIYDAKSGDMVLCRNTVPLVKLYLDFLKRGKKCYIRGIDICKTLMNVINSINIDVLNSSLLNHGFMSVLYQADFAYLNRIRENHNISIKEAINTEEFSRVYEELRTIELLSEGLSTKEELIKRVKEIFIEDDTDGICLSTIHKAKGLEANTVYILCPSLMPSMLATQDWQIQEENNLQYVAITRAKEELNYVDEDIFPPIIDYRRENHIMEELEIKATYIQDLIGYNPLTMEKKEDRHMNNIQRINLNRTEKKENKKIGAKKFGNFLR